MLPFLSLHVCVAAPRCQDDADQSDRLLEWQKCSGVHEGSVALVAQCPGEHSRHPFSFSGAEERGNQTKTGWQNAHRSINAPKLNAFVRNRRPFCGPLVLGIDESACFFCKIEQEKLASLKKVEESKKEKETRERAQSRSPRR